MKKLLLTVISLLIVFSCVLTSCDFTANITVNTGTTEGTDSSKEPNDTTTSGFSGDETTKAPDDTTSTTDGSSDSTTTTPDNTTAPNGSDVTVKDPIDSETTHLVIGTSKLDGVFNPFYVSSGADKAVVEMTQLPMFSVDQNGNIAFGKDEACVILDYEAIKSSNGTTVYRFVLKNDIKFSNGSPLTMKDVFFNLYVYLDPAYYGSSSLYSSDIVGLAEYRTQRTEIKDQESFDAMINAFAEERIIRLVECLEIVYDNNRYTTLTEEEMKVKLSDAVNEIVCIDSKYSTVLEDYELAKKFFREELEKDYFYSVGTAEDIAFFNQNGNKVSLTTDTEAFLYNEGLIHWDKSEYRFEYSLGPNSKDWSKEEAINAVYRMYVPNRMDQVVTYWASANTLLEYFTAVERQNYYDSFESNAKIESISGIRYANLNEGVVVNNVYYAAPTLNSNLIPTSGHEVLEIEVKNADVSEICNFNFAVAPMYYYSNLERIAAFSYTENKFGVEFANINFQNLVIKNPEKIGVPVGAGPYKATTKTGDPLAAVTASTFMANGEVYFERNENFMFEVKTKYINYKEVAKGQEMDALYSGDVHFVEPACKPENIDSIASKKSEGFDGDAIMTNGYGYIGINAEKIPDIAVRKAIMHAINAQYAVDYYFGYSKLITRPITKVSWAYPSEVDALGQYYAYDRTGQICETLVRDAGYVRNADGIYTNGNHICKYTFTIPGDTKEHPAYASLKNAAEILNSHGFEITVVIDPNAYEKMNNGELTVWAAERNDYISPDLYEFYHIDSTSSYVKRWGYNAIKKNRGGRFDIELALLKELSEIIDIIGQSTNKDESISMYAHAFDVIMDLAIELPTYQKSDFFAYNTNVIDVNSMTPASELTPYNNPINRIWEISLNETN